MHISYLSPFSWLYDWNTAFDCKHIKSTQCLFTINCVPLSPMVYYKNENLI